MIFGAIYDRDDVHDLLTVLRLVELQGFRAALQTIMNVLVDTHATCIDAKKMIEVLNRLITYVDEEMGYILSSIDYTERLYKELEKALGVEKKTKIGVTAMLNT